MRRALVISLVFGLLLFALALVLREPQRAQSLSAVALIGSDEVAGFARADQPRQFAFPADFGPHPEFQTEWWYYTGNLSTEEGRHFGYQLTFFRRALLPAGEYAARQSAWATEHIYMAHFALTDTANESHWAFERFSREGPDLAGAQAAPLRVWLEDWSLSATGPDSYRLYAAADGLALSLDLQDLKGPILHGAQGLSQKGPQPGNASYYFSQTRLASQGHIEIEGQRFEVSGLSWMDHEFSTSALGAGQVGWDWFSIQLDDDRELMLFQLRREDGSQDPFSSATLVAPDGSTQHFGLQDFSLQALETWTSPDSGARYPVAWQIEFPELDLSLQLRALLPDQELNLSFIYWEGAVSVSGTQNGEPLSGMGYIEMTGYAQSMAGQF